MPAASLIRPARSGDLLSIVAINQQGQESVWSERQLAQAIEGPETLWVCDIEGQINAFLLWHSVLDEAEIHHFGVALSARRQGMASQMLDYLLSHCPQHGIARIFLEVRDGNEAAKALYLKHGFVINGRRKGYYQTATGPEDAILMEKTC
ncbi:MAG: ribosomal protein S18-alanine N-acetyltransferase [Neisseriaceae bacterium]|nr:ribosomal protein S18-alanine N-acetyltransferase [Neisseriaceae bacterium]MBP6862916.1 ribosomal protein S18-alanine N-acetyltransferase [Neisseriaceae bacterium]